MVHGVRLRGGRAEWYRNRWVRSSQVTTKLGEAYPGQAPPDDFACNTRVIPYKGRILAMQEGGPLPYELDGELNTVRPYDSAPLSRAPSPRTPSTTRGRRAARDRALPSPGTMCGTS